MFSIAQERRHVGPNSVETLCGSLLLGSYNDIVHLNSTMFLYSSATRRLAASLLVLHFLATLFHFNFFFLMVCTYRTVPVHKCIRTRVVYYTVSTSKIL